MIQTVDLFVNVMKLSYSIIKSVMSHKFQKKLKKSDCRGNRVISDI